MGPRASNAYRVSGGRPAGALGIVDTIHTCDMSGLLSISWTSTHKSRFVAACAMRTWLETRVVND